MSELKINNGSEKLIVCFGGKALQFGMILPFEFLNYLSSLYRDICDLYFFIDKHQCWYHKGLEGITESIDETVIYINNVIKKGCYKKVIFMGVSAGGYGAILFGSLCNNVNNVISFIPQTKIPNAINPKYADIKNVINKKTSYLLYGDKSIEDENNNHHISQCNNIREFSNVKIIEGESSNIKMLRDNGFIKKQIDDIIFPLEERK